MVRVTLPGVHVSNFPGRSILHHSCGGEARIFRPVSSKSAMGRNKSVRRGLLNVVDHNHLTGPLPFSSLRPSCSRNASGRDGPIPRSASALTSGHPGRIERSGHRFLGILMQVQGHAGGAVAPHQDATPLTVKIGSGQSEGDGDARQQDAPSISRLPSTILRRSGLA